MSAQQASLRIGEEPRIEGAGRGNEVAHHEAHRRTDGIASRKPPTRIREQRRARQEALDDLRHEVLRGEPLDHRGVVSAERVGRPAELRVDRLGGQARADERPVEPLAGERVEEADGVAGEEPAGSGPPCHAAAQRGCPGERTVTGQPFPP